jgi:uncharacterized OsmC-like protein
MSRRCLVAEGKDRKTLVDRNIKAIKLRPTIGQGTATTTVRIRDGVTCDVEDGQWKLIADEMPGDGGAGLGPDAGVFGRAALGTCLAMGYVTWAAHLGVPLDSVEVVVEADYDARGMYGVDDTVAPGWTAMRYTVNIASPAAEEKVREMVEYADRLSPLLDDFKRPIPVTRELRIAQSSAE